MAHICINTPEKSKNKQVKNTIHAHLLFNSQGIFHTEFLPQGQTVDQFYYCDIFEILRKRVVRVRPSIANNLMLHHDNPLVTWRSLLSKIWLKRAFLWFYSPHSPII
jgi:hypothetical protein